MAQHAAAVGRVASALARSAVRKELPHARAKALESVGVPAAGSSRTGMMLRERREVPRVATIGGEDRLIILPDEDDDTSTSAGRPVGGEYFDTARKLQYMDTHNIGVSVLSLANPWLDFLSAAEAPDMAKLMNDDMQNECDKSGGRFYGFGVLPTADIDASCAELERIASMERMRGIIFSTHGLGRGLDDPRLLPVYQTVEKLGLTIFLHPHYGVGVEHFEGYGHALYLALGFTFETTTAISRLILSGLLDKVPDLKLLLAHTGGTLPFLAGRLDSCYKHDLHLAGTLEHLPSEYLQRMFYDGIAYHFPALDCAQQMVGTDRIMFGTDHPFFPPPGVPDTGDPTLMDRTPWISTVANQVVAEEGGEAVANAVLRDNALRLLNLEMPE